MNLYCYLAYRKCFELDCDGVWCLDGEEGLHDGSYITCNLLRDKYGRKSKRVKLISEFKWLMNRAIYRGKK